MIHKFPGVRQKECISPDTNKKDIRFCIRYTVNGKQHEESIGKKSQGWTAQKAYEILCKLKQHIKNGTAFSLKEINEQEQAKREQLLEAKQKEKTLSEIFLQDYFPHFQVLHKKSTNDRELILFRTWIEPHLGSLRLAQISRISLIRLRNEIAHKGLSPRSQNYAIALVRQIFNFALKYDLYDGKNPASNFEFIKVDNARTKYFDDNQLRQLLDGLKKRSYTVYLITLISLESGLRRGEIFNLTWADIDLKAREILVKDTKNHLNRYAPMSECLYAELIKLPQQNPNQYLFTSRNGKKMTTLSRTFERVVKELGFNKGIIDRRQQLVFHSCRHTFASRLVERNVPLYDVAHLMGHSTLKMTQRYAHLSNAKLSQAVESASLSTILNKDNNNE